MTQREKKTSEEWFQLGILKESQLLDLKGWNRENIYESWYKEVITKEEFIKRALNSTGAWSKEFRESINE